MTSRHVAIDLGASGGRIAVGTVSHGSLSVEVLHRFPNGGTWLPTGLYWNHLGLWAEILHGLSLAGQGGAVDTVGVNSWGVDYALLDENGLLLDGVHHYRDLRTEGVMEKVFERMPREEIYHRTGIQFMPLNTIYQLVAHDLAAPGILSRARRLLFVPDLIHHFLCGSTVSELTIASTSQLYDPRRRAWDRRLMAQCGIPEHLFGEIVEPGTLLGEVRPEIGVAGAKVIAPASHDTASAVAAVPASRDRGWAYLSSGTWALAGVECQAPVIDDQTLSLNLTNEAGVDGTTRLLKNITGLWILQECRRAWGNPDYEALYSEAEAAFCSARIDPDDARFAQVADDMPGQVRAFCEEAGQTPPQTRGEIVRCILESLADRSAQVVEQLQSVTGSRIETIHIVGGGSQIGFLNQLIANASGREVVAGPTDATLIGNLLVQAQGFGRIAAGELRVAVRQSAEFATFKPN